MENKTTIVIAHRLSTLLHMNRILVFDQGKIVQDGSHSELVSTKGLYRTLWNSQIDNLLRYSGKLYEKKRNHPLTGYN